MPRKPRIEYKGAVYHVMSRGNRGEAIFRDDSDHETFLETLGQACGRAGWLIHAYVLMGNHYHLLLETPQANLVVGMRWLQSTYTQRFNVRHQEYGHLLQGRYKALVIDPDQEQYFEVVSSYIHLNPARTRSFDCQPQRLSDFRWSSYPHYMRASNRPAWLVVDRVLSALGWKDAPKGRSAYRRYMQRCVRDLAASDDPREARAQWSNLRRGWFFGDDTFRDVLLDLVDGVRSNTKAKSHSGAEVTLHDERGAEKLKRRAMQILGLKNRDLSTLPKGAIVKKLLVWYIHTRTTASNAWLSENIGCGHEGNVSKYTREISKTKDRQIGALRKKLESGD